MLKKASPESVLKETIDECFSLYSKGAGSLGYPVDQPSVRKLLRENVEVTFKSAIQHGGLFRFYRNTSGKMLAAIVAKRGSNVSLYRNSEAYWTFDLYSAPGSKKSVRLANAWFSKECVGIRKMMGPQVEAYIQPWQVPVLPALNSVGIHAAGLALVGSIPFARDQLQKKYPHIESEFEDSPYLFRPIRTRSDTDAYIEILRQEFNRNPHFGWFVGHPEALAKIRSGILKNIRSKKFQAWVIERNRKIVGGFDFSYSEKSVLKKGSIGVNFSRSIQGKGLARFAYWIALREMHRVGARIFEGTTAQPGVLALAKVMGRKCVAIEVLELEGCPIEKAFPKNYFEGWIRTLSKNRFIRPS